MQALGAELPLWVSVDQEGGRVARLKAPFTEWPPMATLGRGGDAALAERFARALAAELRAVGITLDYAPVLDIHTNPKNPVIGDRALADAPRLVARLGASIIRDAAGRRHGRLRQAFSRARRHQRRLALELPLVEHPPDRLRAVEFVPFRAAIAAGVASIMTAHVLVPSLDEERPATLSPHDRARCCATSSGSSGVDPQRRSGDEGGQRAVTPVPEAAVQAIAAGCDGVLMCSGDVDAAGAARSRRWSRRRDRARCR